MSKKRLALTLMVIVSMALTVFIVRAPEPGRADDTAATSAATPTRPPERDRAGVPAPPPASSDDPLSPPSAPIDPSVTPDAGVDDGTRLAEPEAEPTPEEQFGERFADSVAALEATLVASAPERTTAADGRSTIVTRLTFRVDRVVRHRPDVHFATGETITTTVLGGALPSGEQVIAPHAYKPPAPGSRSLLMFSMTADGHVFMPGDKGALARLDGDRVSEWNGFELDPGHTPDVFHQR
jgi:hypothetical protein